MEKGENITLEDYQLLEKDLYDSFIKSGNPIRRWVHKKRFDIVYNLVNRYYKKGDIILDLACGNCNWNKDKLPVIGVDISERMLNYALSEGRIIKYYNNDITKTNLIEDTANIIIATEIIEHLESPNNFLFEVRRLLKDGGIVIASVPYDTFLSLWRPLFKINCFVQGDILGKKYFKNNGGHVNFFSPKLIEDLFLQNGFKILELKNNVRFTIFIVCQKNMPIFSD